MILLSGPGSRIAFFACVIMGSILGPRTYESISGVVLPSSSSGDTGAVSTATTSTSAHCHFDKKKEKLKIFVIVEPSPITYMSGYTNRYLHLFSHLSQHHRDDKVRIITTEVVQPNRPTSYLGFPVLYTRGFRLLHYPLVSLSCDWTLRIPLCLIQDRPDLIHVSSPGFYVLSTVLWARLLQIPVVMSYHTHLPVYVRSYFSRPIAAILESFVWFLLRIYTNMADLTLVTSNAIQNEFCQHGMPDTRLWPKGVNTTRFHPKWASREWRRRLSDNHPDDCILLYVGRLAVEKRLHELRAIMDHLPQNYRLALVGKGPYEMELRKLFADCNRVHFMGPLYGENLQRTYASADVFLMPSDSETLGFVVMESMASGVPVVAAKAGGIPDVVQDGDTGFLVPVGDVDAFVHAISRIGIDHLTERKAMGARARLLTEKWTWEESMSVLRNEIYTQARRNFRKRWEQMFWRLVTFQQ